MHKVEEKVFATRRKSLLGSLHGKVLDVGSGTGANFPWFSADAEVIALEPNDKMLEIARKKIPEGANITLVHGGVGDGKTVFPENSFDYIVTTLVLCTIPDQELAFKMFKKWLKPEGRLLLIEHIRALKKHIAVMQDVFNPAWKAVADGCNMNRSTDQAIKKAGFKPVNENYFKLGFDWYEGVFELR